jgi:nucleoside 2-deoxyribosyltransferase
MEKIKIYLAGHCEGGKDAPNWRKKIIDKFGLFENVEFLYPRTGISYDERSLAQTERHRRGYTFADMIKVENSHIVFAFIDNNTQSLHSGTSCEIGYGRRAGKFIILVKENPSNRFNLIKNLADKVCDTFDDGMAILEDIIEEFSIREIK